MRNCWNKLSRCKVKLSLYTGFYLRSKRILFREANATAQFRSFQPIRPRVVDLFRPHQIALAQWDCSVLLCVLREFATKAGPNYESSWMIGTGVVVTFSPKKTSIKMLSRFFACLPTSKWPLALTSQAVKSTTGNSCKVMCTSPVLPTALSVHPCASHADWQTLQRDGRTSACSLQQKQVSKCLEVYKDVLEIGSSLFICFQINSRRHQTFQICSVNPRN